MILEFHASVKFFSMDLRMDLSLRLARHISEIEYDDLPDHVVDITKKSFLDGLGVILAASSLGEGCQAFAELAKLEGGRGESTIISFNTKASPWMAAFANGSMAHAIDFEDVHDEAEVHPNAAAIPAALAIAESIGRISGKEFITALALGSDIVCRLGLARDQSEDPLRAGWYLPPILGAFGATASVSKLLRLSPEQILDAFSLVLCQATCSAELINSPHSVIRAVRDGFSAKAGVLSALLARKGIRGFDQPIEGKAGLFTMYLNGKYDPFVLTKELGKTFEGANVSFKPWPSCRGTHPFIQAALQLVNENRIELNEVKEIKLMIAPSSLSRMLCEPIERKRAPKTAIDAKFSIPFTVAVALTYRNVSLEHFTPKALLDRKVLDVAQRITYEVYPELDSRQGFVQIKTEDKAIISKDIEYVYGHPKNPISQEALVSKFMDCGRYSAKRISQEDLRKLSQWILHLEDMKNIVEMMSYL